MKGEDFSIQNNGHIQLPYKGRLKAIVAIPGEYDMNKNNRSPQELSPYNF